MSYYHVLLLNKKDHNPDVLDRQQAAIDASLRALDLNAIVRTAKEDYLARIEKTEGYEDWCRIVAVGTNPVYEVFFVSDTIIGKATEMIITLALRSGKQVVFMSEAGDNFRRVAGTQLIRGGKSGKLGGSWVEYAKLRIAPEDPF